MDRRIDELQRRGAATPQVIGLGGGLPAPELFPRIGLAASFFRVIGAPAGQALQYGWPEGQERLRSWVAARLRRRGAAILEDDAYADLHFAGAAGPPLLARDRRRVWHIGTLSKSLCPGLRVGWLVPPRAQREAAIESKRQVDLQANSLSQAILEDFLGNIDFDALTSKASRFYARRARRLARALRRHLCTWRFRAPVGGFAIWAETDVEGDDASFLEVALQQGVSFDPGSSFRVAPSA